MSYILTPLSLTQRISNLLLNAPGTFTFKSPNWATHINITCVGGGGLCGDSFFSTDPRRNRGGGGGGGGALAYADTIPLNGNTIITARVANSNSLKAFSEEQTSFVALNSTVIVEASSGLAGGDLNPPTSSSTTTGTNGGAGGIVLVGNGGNGKPGGNADTVSETVRTTSPVMSWRRYQGGRGGGAGGYSNDADNGGGGYGGARTYRYLLGTFNAGYLFHELTARFSGGGVGLFGKGSNGFDGGVQTLWDGNSTSQRQPDNYSTVSGGAGSSGFVRRYGGGMGGGARYFSSSGGTRFWYAGPQDANGAGGNSQIFAGTGAVRIQFLSS